MSIEELLVQNKEKGTSSTPSNLDHLLSQNKEINFQPGNYQTPFPLSETSQYDKGLGTSHTPEDIMENRGLNQSRLAKWSRGLANTGTGLFFDTLKDTSYLLDWEQVHDLATGKEEEFSNAFADAMEKAKQTTKLDVYRTEESKGFHPESSGWWADNLPSLASTLSMILPTTGAIRGLSMVGRALKGAELLKAIGVAGETVEGISGAVLSRYMENTMEGKQTFDSTYQEAISKGKSPEEATQVAGEAARNNWVANSAMILQDIPQYMTLFKGFKGAKALFGKAESITATTLSEGGEEAYQYITDKETKRNALINHQVIKDDNTSFGDRMKDYSSDGEFWTSAFMGALGGGIFEGIASYKDHKTQNKFDSILQQHRGVLTGDEKEYNRGVDNQINESIIQAVGQPKGLQKLYNDLSFLKSNPERIEDEDQRKEVNKNIDKTLKQIEYAQEAYLISDLLSQASPEIKGQLFSTLINQKSIEGRLGDIRRDLHKLKLEDQMLMDIQDPSLHDYKIALLKYEAIKSLPKLKKQTNQLSKNIQSIETSLWKTYKPEEKDANKAIQEIKTNLNSSNNNQLVSLLKNEAIESNDLQEARKIFQKLQTPEGRKEAQEDLEKFKTKKEKESKQPPPIPQPPIVTPESKEVSLNEDVENRRKESLSEIHLENEKGEIVDTPEEASFYVAYHRDIEGKQTPIKNPDPNELKATINERYNSELTNKPQELSGETREDLEFSDSNSKEDEELNKDGATPDNWRKTQSSVQTNSELQEELYTFNENLVLDGHKLLVVTKLSNLKLFEEITKQYGKTEGDETSILTVLVDKNNTPLTLPQSGKYVSYSLERNRLDITKEEAKNLVYHAAIRVVDRDTYDTALNGDGKAKQEAINRILDENKIQHLELTAFRDNLSQSTSPTYLKITGKSRGLTYDSNDPTFSAYDKEPKSVIGSIFDNLSDITSDRLFISTLPNQKWRGWKTSQGKLYVESKDGRVFQLNNRRLTPEEIDNIYNLLVQYFDRVRKNQDPKEIEQNIKKITFFSFSKEHSDNQMYFKGNQLFIGGNQIPVTIENFEASTDYIKEALSKKRTNANTLYIGNKDFTHPISGEKISYQEFLLSGASPMFTTNLKPKFDKDGKPNRRFIQVYLKYDTTPASKEKQGAFSLDELLPEKPAVKKKRTPKPETGETPLSSTQVDRLPNNEYTVNGATTINPEGTINTDLGDNIKTSSLPELTSNIDPLNPKNRIISEKGSTYLNNTLKLMEKLGVDYIYDNNKTTGVYESSSNREKILQAIKGRITSLYNKVLDTGTEEQLDNFDYFLENEDNWKALSDLWEKRVLSREVKDIIDTPEDTEEFSVGEDNSETLLITEEGKSKDSFEDSNLRSAKEGLSNRLKSLIRSLTDPSSINPTYGGNNLVDFASTWAYIINHVEGLGSSYRTLYDKLGELSLHKPELIELRTRLGSPDVEDTEKIDFQTEFLQAFNKTKTPQSLTLIGANGEIRTIDANRQAEIERTRLQWEEGLRESKFTIQNPDGKLITELYKPSSNETSNIPDLEFLKRLGLSFSPATEEVISKYEGLDKTEFEISVTAIRAYIIHHKGDVSNLYYTPKNQKKEDTKFNVVSRLTKLTELEAIFNPFTSEGSVLSPDGNTNYTVGNNTSSSLRYNEINNSTSLADLSSREPSLLQSIGVKGSLWMKHLFTNGVRNPDVRIERTLSSGINTSDTDEKIKLTTKKGTYLDMLSQQAIHILQGRSSRIVSSDKSQEIQDSLSDYNGSPTPVSIADLENSFDNSRVKEIFKDYFLSELEGIVRYRLDDLGKNVQYYTVNGGKWTVFQDILSSKAKKSIDDLIQQFKDSKTSYLEAEQSINELVSSQEFNHSLENDVLDFLEKYSNEVLNEFEEEGLISREEGKLISSPGISSDYTSKYNINQISRTIVLTDLINSIEQTKLLLGNLAFYKDPYKRFNMYEGDKLVPRVDQEINNHLNKLYKRSDGKLADGFENILVYQNLEKTHPFYKKMDIADAQGYGSMDFIREYYKRMQGGRLFWTPAHEEIYQIDREQEWNDRAELIKGKLLTKEQTTLFYQLKLQYAGETSYKGDKNGEENTNGLYIPAGLKFTVLPLLKQAVAGKNHQNLIKVMAAKQSGIVTFISGNKFGTILNKQGKANQFYSKEGEVNQDIDSLLSQQISYKYLGLQVQPSPPHPTTIFATQLRSIIWGGAFENGEETFEGAKELFKQFNKAIYDRVKADTKKLEKELGITSTNYSKRDLTKVVELLRREAMDRTLPDNILNSLDIQIERGEALLKYNIDSMVNKPKIDNLLMSLVNNRVIKQQFNGDAYVLASPAGFEDIGTKNYLRGYSLDASGQVIPAQCMIPLSKEYYSLMEKHGGSLQSLNQAIKEGKASSKALELIGVRIPGQGHNSTEYLTIYQFLPENSATTMVAHEDIVGKAGSDYDNDKLYTYRPNLDKEGDYVLDNYDNKLVEIVKNIISHPSNFQRLITPNSTSMIEEVTNDLRYLEYVNKQTKAGRNIQSKEDYFDTLEGKALSNIRFTNLLNLVTKTKARYKLLTAKDTLSIGAITNSYSSIANASNLSMNSTVQWENREGKKEKIKLLIPHNSKNEGYDLSSGRSIQVEYTNSKGEKTLTRIQSIQELHSQMINIMADAAKEDVPMVSVLNIDMETAPLYAFLIQNGVPLVYIGNFFNQPIIKDYQKAISSNKTVFNHKTKKPTKTVINEVRGKWGKKINDNYKYQEHILSLDELIKYQHTNNQEGSEYSSSQLQVLDEFLKIKQLASAFSNGIRTTNHASNGVGENLNAVRNKEKSISKVEEEKHINGLERVKETFLGAFNLDQFTLDQFSPLYYIEKPVIIQELSSITENVINKSYGRLTSSKDQTKLSNLITNDFINFVIQNYGYEDVHATFDRLFKGKNSLPKRIFKIQEDKSNPLNQNTLIKYLYPLIDKARSERDKSSGKQPIDNLKIYKSRLDTDLSNDLTYAFKELWSTNPELAQDIADLGILQSGLNNSHITFYGLIPVEYANELTKKAFEEFNKKNGEDRLLVFRQLFYENNTKHPLVKAATVKSDWGSGELIQLYTPKGYGDYGKDYWDNGEITDEQLDEITEEQSQQDSLATTNHPTDNTTRGFDEDGNFIDTSTVNLGEQTPLSSFRKEIKLPNKPVSNLNQAMINKRVDEYNIKNGTKHYINWKQIGESDNYEVESITERWDKFNPFQTKLAPVNYKIDLSLESRYFNSGREQKAVDILNKISQAKGVMANLAKHLIEYSKHNNISIHLDDLDIYPKGEKYSLDQDSTAYYSHSKQEIRIAKNALFLGGRAESVILHEILHSLTWHLLHSNLEVREDFNKLYEYTKQNLKDQYSLKNIDEFLVALFTKSEFIKQLQSLPALKDTKPYKNLLQQLIDHILGYLNIKPSNNIYNQAFAVATNILEQARDYNKFNEDQGNSSSNSTINPELTNITNSNGEASKTSSVDVEDIKQLSKQEQYLYRRISRLTKEISLEKNPDKVLKLNTELHYNQELLQKSKVLDPEKIFLELGEHTLEEVSRDIESMIKGTPTDHSLEYINEVLDVWGDFQGLKDRTGELKLKLDNLMSKWLETTVNDLSFYKKGITIEDINEQNKDVGKRTEWFGSLTNNPNWLVHSIGALTLKAQTKRDKKTIHTYEKIKTKIDELEKKGVKIDTLYKEIITYNEDTDSKSLVDEDQILTKSKEAQEFYKFYQEHMEELMKIAPLFTRKNQHGELETFVLNKYFIPNVYETDLKEQLSKLKLIKERKLGDTTKDEEQKSDAIQLDYIRHIPSNKKSNNLGGSLQAFSHSIYNYDEMSNVLPTLRLLQREIEKRTYTQGSNPNFTKTGKESNIWVMTEAYIRAQVHGKTKLEQLKPSIGKEIVDEKGNRSEKYLDILGWADRLLRLNSMVRIGLSPVASGANLAYGKLSNLVEAFGSRYFNRRELRQAEKIFWKQNFDKESILNTLLKDLSILQELTDYEFQKELKIDKKKISRDKLIEFLYSGQRAGEKYIQSSSFLAMLIREGYMNTEGELTAKYKSAKEDEVQAFADKVRGVNDIMHGRYSQKEQGSAMQNIIGRSVMQFRKYLSSAIEARLDEKHFNPRIGMDVEGRYITTSRLLKQLFDSSSDLRTKGWEGLSELEKYNMKKMVVETILALGALFLYSIGTGDDDEDKKRRKQAWFKSTMLLLNRVSGDISFWYSPQQLNNLAKNAVPMTKLINDLISIGVYSDRYLGGEITKSFTSKNKFTSGNNKGLYRLPTKVFNVLPGNKIGTDFFKAFNKQQLDNIN